VDEWGGPVGLGERAPSRVGDAAFSDWWASYLRLGASPGAAVALTRMNAEIDVRAVLPSIGVPTLVLHRTGDRCLKVEEGRYLASRIPGARFIELAGDDHLPFVGDQDAMLREIDSFLSDTHARPSVQRMLGTVLTVNWDQRIGQTALRAAVKRETEWARGEQLIFDDARLVAAFDGPGRAVRCGAAIVYAAGQSGIPARAGVHIGERHLSAKRDPIVETSARLAEAAPPGNVYVSRTVVDLVPGSGLRFEDRGLIPALSTKGDLAVLAVVN
jgi:hypothetical protein